MIKPLPTPSEFFRWCLDVADSDQIPIRRSYPKYAALGNANGYLWEHYDARIDSLGKMLSPSRRVLEIGCGLGIELHWMALHGATVLGTEVDTYSVECAKRLTSLVRQTFGRGLDVEIIRSSVLNLPQDAQFEMIYLKETLHHLEPRDAVFQRISKLLTTGGEILVLEPNALNPLIQLEMLMKRGTKTIVEAVDAVNS